MGLKGFDIVVDAACGNGYWLTSLAGLNGKIIGFDNYKPAIIEASKLTQNINNVSLAFANMADSFLKTGSVDVVFCSDSMNFVNPNIAMKNFYEVLKKGGLVYASVNGFGWALYCIFHRGFVQKDFKKINMGIMMIINTFIRKFISKNYPVSNSFYTISDLTRIAKDAGFQVVHAGPEGSLNNKDFKNYPPRFEPRYLGFKSSLEILLKK
jgi:SAM-dependent methyltransferase